MSHDQRFKNLILDYPRDALRFFAPTEAQQIDDTVRFIPIRQEQLKERLGERFRELDTPLWVEWPDGRREILLFVVEEHTETGRFSIHKLVHYCVDLSELFDTRRVVPVVVFLHRGRFDTYLKLSGDHGVYLEFRFLYCDRPSLRAQDYLASDNLVARLNVLNMAYPPEDRVAVFHAATEGLANLESDREKQLKYRGFIDAYVQLSEEEYRRYEDEFLANSASQGLIMNYTEYLIKKGRKEALLSLLAKRFGPQRSAALRQRLEGASTEELDTWTLRVLDAGSVEAVFAGEGADPRPDN